jgi:hypothetical protein
MAGSSSPRGAFPRTWPPASTPCATTRSHPAASAARPSPTEPTWHETRAPPLCPAATRLSSGSPSKDSTTLTVLAASAMTSTGGRYGIKKPIPEGPSSAGGGSTPWGTMPRPPPVDTAAASSVVPTPPSTASWKGSRQPTRRVKRVSTVRTLDTKAVLQDRSAPSSTATCSSPRLTSAPPPSPGSQDPPTRTGWNRAIPDASSTHGPASFPSCSSARNADEVSCPDAANCRRLRGAAARGHGGPPRSDRRHRAWRRCCGCAC